MNRYFRNLAGVLNYKQQRLPVCPAGCGGWEWWGGYGAEHGAFHFHLKYFSITCIVLQQGHCKIIKIKIRSTKGEKERNPQWSATHPFLEGFLLLKGFPVPCILVPKAASYAPPHQILKAVDKEEQFFPSCKRENWGSERAVICPRAHQQEVVEEVALERAEWVPQVRGVRQTSLLCFPSSGSR